MPKRFITAGMLSALLLAGGGYSAYAEAASALQQTAGTCTGTIVDAAGEGIIGATVRVKDSSKATATDLDGNFSLTGVKPGSILEITCIGYTATEVTWNGQPVHVTMKDASKALDELVVVGYGVQKKANVTGAVSSVKADQIENRAVASVSSALAGEMPGVVVVQSSGAPGGQTGSITVRGANSINAAQPLVIVDGVPGSMNNIDVQDIESVSVLKDAASAAIYGVQAANGVILITTKKGKANTAPRITYSGSVSFSTPTTHLDKVNAYEHTFLMREALLNQNPDANVATYDAAIAKYESGELDKEGTDWYDATFKGHGTETAHTVQISGGSENTTYMASMGYLYQGGILDQNDYNRYNGRINLDSKIRPWVALGTQLSFFRGIRKDLYNGVGGVMQHANRLAANLNIYDEDGDFLAPAGMQNPVAEVTGDYPTGIRRIKDDQLFANVYLNITPIDGLSIRPLFSWRHDYQDNYGFRKVLLYGGSYNGGDNGQRYGERTLKNWDRMTYQVVANYNKTFAEKHNLGVLGGYESLRYMYRFTQATRTGGGDNALDQVLASLNKDKWTNNDNGADLTRQSWFGRVTYDFDSRYLFEANFRADASSRFAKKNRWGYFPAVSAAWRISQESFMENTRSWLSGLKLRLGWGKTGNEELEDIIENYYPAVATYTYYPLLIGTSQYTSMYATKYANKDLKWATVTNWELGIEASFLNNMFSFEGSVYKKETTDMLLNLPILSVLGFGAPLQNAGSVENKGVDLTFGYQQRINKDWSVNATLNVGYNHNEITNLAGTEGPNPNDKLQWYIEGEAIGSYYGYICDGLFKNQAEVDAGPLRTGTEKPGNLRYKDLDGDGRITEADRAVMGKTSPSWMGGLNVGVNFRNFDFSMLWQGAWDYERYMTAEAAQAFYNNASMNKWQMEQRWTPENPNGTYPRLYPNSSGSPDVVTNSFWCEDASYLRLKSLTLGYTLPTAITGRIGLDNVRVYFNGENLLTFSKLFDKNIDPEAPAGRGNYYANVRKLSLGLKLSF